MEKVNEKDSFYNGVPVVEKETIIGYLRANVYFIVSPLNKWITPLPNNSKIEYITREILDKWLIGYMSILNSRNLSMEIDLKNSIDYKTKYEEITMQCKEAYKDTPIVTNNVIVGYVRGGTHFIVSPLKVKLIPVEKLSMPNVDVTYITQEVLDNWIEDYVSKLRTKNIEMRMELRDSINYKASYEDMDRQCEEVDKYKGRMVLNGMSIVGYINNKKCYITDDCQDIVYDTVCERNDYEGDIILITQGNLDDWLIGHISSLNDRIIKLRKDIRNSIDYKSSYEEIAKQCEEANKELLDVKRHCDYTSEYKYTVGKEVNIIIEGKVQIAIITDILLKIDIDGVKERYNLKYKDDGKYRYIFGIDVSLVYTNKSEIVKSLGL
jgi:hypothetical protein